MKHGRTLSRLFGIGLAVAAATAAAQTTANGPYYATPSWDQTMAASTRFVVLSNFNSDAVLDRETGLVWARALSTITESYASAAHACAVQVIGSRLGWRLPSSAELNSLFDPTIPAPFLPAGHPFTGFSADTAQTLWSSTSASASSHVAAGRQSSPYIFYPYLGYADTLSSNYLCVRGGPGTSSVP